MLRITSKIITILISVLVLLSLPFFVFSSSDLGVLYGGEFNDEVAGIVASAEDGYVILGTTSSFGAGGADFWLIKIAEEGNTEWNQTYGGIDSDVATNLVYTNDGGYVLFGKTRSFGDGENDFWLIKVDSMGNMQWNKTFGTQADDIATCLIQTTDGGYALGGYWLENGSACDGLLIKIDSLGNTQWIRTYGGAGSESIFSLVQTTDGGYALAGSTASYDEDGANADYWLVKTDSNGIMEWNKTYGQQNTNSAKSLIYAVDGGYTLAGFVRHAIVAPSDVWVLHVDSSGNSVWNVTWSSVDYAMVNDMIQTKDGAYLVSGATQYLEGFADLRSFMFLLKIDSNGTMEWIKKFDGLGYNNSLFVSPTKNDGYILAGTTKELGEETQYDIWFTKSDLDGNSIPEFSSFLLLPLCLSALLLIVVIKKKAFSE